MAGSQPTKPWLGTLNSGELGRRMSGRCVWAEGHELPYIQQGIMSDSCGDSLGDFRLPSPTSPTASRDWDRVTSSHDVTADVRPHSESFEIAGTPYVLHAYTTLRNDEV